MERPSGDQRGPKTGSEPGRREIWRLFKSNSWTNMVSGWRLSLLLKAKVVPSRDQVGSVSKSLRRSDGLRRAPIGGDDEDFPGFSRLGCAEGDGLAIGGPMRSSSAQRRIGELETLRAVELAAPKGIVGITDISDPFAVA